MSYTPDPSMLLDPSLGLGSSGLAQPSPMQPPAQPPIGAVPGQPPGVNDPMVGMFLNSMQGGPAQQLPQQGRGVPFAPGAEAGQLAPGPGGPSIPTKPIATGNPAAQDHQPGVLKRMLMNFVYTGGETLKHSLGMPTDAEIQAGQQKQASDAANAARIAQAADDTHQKFLASQKTRDWGPTARAMGLDWDENTPLNLTDAQGPAFIKTLAVKNASDDKHSDALKKIDAATIHYNAEHGYETAADGTRGAPVDFSKMSLQDQQKIMTARAQETYSKARADWLTDPDNPVRKATLGLAQQRLQQEQQRTSIMNKNYLASTYGIGEDGQPLPGSLTDTQGNPIGARFQGNLKATAMEKKNMQLAQNASDNLTRVRELVIQHPEWFGTTGGVATKFKLALGMNDPDARAFVQAHQLAALPTIGIHGVRGRYALEDFTKGAGPLWQSQQSYLAGLGEVMRSVNEFKTPPVAPNVQRGKVSRAPGQQPAKPNPDGTW